MKIQMFEQPLLRSFIWMLILILVLMFWPRNVMVDIEPEVITETYFVYVEKEPSLVEEVIFEEVDDPVVIPRYGFTDDDIYLMTVLLCGSAITDGDGEYDIDFGNQDNHEQISLVLGVVMNRVMSDNFPDTVAEVIWARNQFHPMDRWRAGLPMVKEESYDIVKAWCERYDAYELSAMSIPESHLFFRGDGLVNRSRERW